MLNRLLALVAAAGLVVTSGALAAPATADSDDAQIKLNEHVRGSLVYVQTTYRGHVLVPAEAMQSGKPLRSEETTATFTCSGFVVDPSGFVTTAGHCVDPEGSEVLESLRENFVVDSVIAGMLDRTAAESFLSTANEEQWEVEGYQRGSKPDREVVLIQPDSANRVLDRQVTAQVVDFENFMDGDNALLKVVVRKPMQALVVAEEAPKPGQSLTSVGWPGSVAGSVDPSRLPEPSFKSGTASSTQVKPSGAQSTEVNADISGGMSGGPTVDNDTGEVLGVNSYGIVGETQAFNFITDASDLRAFLSKNGVHLTQSVAPAQKSFPWGVIVAILVFLAVVALLVVIVQRRRTGVTQAAAPQPEPLQPPAP